MDHQDHHYHQSRQPDAETLTELREMRVEAAEEPREKHWGLEMRLQMRLQIRVEALAAEEPREKHSCLEL